MMQMLAWSQNPTRPDAGLDDKAERETQSLALRQPKHMKPLPPNA